MIALKNNCSLPLQCLRQCRIKKEMEGNAHRISQRAPRLDDPAKENAMLSKEESQLKNAMKLLLKDGKNGPHFEAAKERYIRLKSDERIVNIAMDLDPKGFEFWVKEFSNDCEIINNLIK